MSPTVSFTPSVPEGIDLIGVPVGTGYMFDENFVPFWSTHSNCGPVTTDPSPLT